MSETTYQYVNDYERRYFQWAGIEVVSANQGQARVRMPVQPYHRGGGGTDAVNGGIAAYLFDGLLGAAVRSIWDEAVRGQVTMTLNIQYLSPLLVQEVVTAYGEVTHQGRTAVYVRGEIYDDRGLCAMTASGIYHLFRAREK
jgi:uncharacterized protein (TIGR00369 family)